MERDNFKGCEVIYWDFEGDAPILLVNQETFQVHCNLEYLPDDWDSVMNAEMLRDGGIDPTHVHFEKTSF